MAKLSSSDSSGSLSSPCPSSITIKENEKVFTSALLKPLYITAAYLFLLRIMGESLRSEAAESDPFQKVWWSGPIFFTFFYLFMVFAGKKFMENRKEFQIKPYIFTYNLYQCILNLWCMVAMIYEVCQNPWFKQWWAVAPQPGMAGFKISFLVWIHYNNKYVELLDTLFMILRKKNNQISFLHCYHHILLIWAWFLVCKVQAGGDVYFGAAVNSGIHVIMYGYYTLALLNVPCPWKKSITTMQLCQFCLCFAHATYSYVYSEIPRILPLFQMFVMTNMLVLFGNFYMKSYGKKSTKEA